MDTLAIIKRIELRLAELGMSKADFYAKSGISSASYSQWNTGKYKPSDTKLRRAAEVLDVTLDYLKGTAQISIPTGPNIYPMPRTEWVPRVGQIACGEPIVAEQNIEGHDEVLSSWHADFTLMCIGDSMAPKIEDGDIVAIRIQPTVGNGEIAAVRIGDEATLKRVFFHPDYIELRPINPNYDSIIRSKSEMEDVRIEGKAVGLCRNL